MKRFSKILMPVIILLLLLVGCKTNPTFEPKIYGIVNEYSLFVGEIFRPLDGVSAFDDTGEEITDQLEVFGNIPTDEENKLTTPGIYEYYVLYKKGSKYIIDETVTLTVLEKPEQIIDEEKPVINANSSYVFEINDLLVLNVTAVDNVDGDLTSKLIVNGLDKIPVDGNNRLTMVGRYRLLYEVKDAAKNNATKEVIVIVCEDSIYDEIERENIVADEYKNLDKTVSGDGYMIVWTDEFNYQGAPNPEYWGYDIGTGNWGWGNNEKQYYTDRSKNVRVENGNLIINALKESYNGSSYTSTRLVSKNKVDIKYGRIEIKAKLPSGGGTWPALWMLPTGSPYGGWPKGGEIDIMEHVGNKQDYILGTCHMQAYNGGNGRGKTIYAKGVSENFNVYGIEWTPDSISFLYNDEIFYTYTNPKYSTDSYKTWPFDQKFHLLINIAMGGMLGGNIDPNFKSCEMLVDYVRVYQKDYTGSDTITPGEVVVTSKKATSDSIELTWNKVNDSVGLKHYEIIVNGVQLAATTKTSYIIKNLNPNTDYHIQVLAVDLADNYSTSGNFVVTTNTTKSVVYVIPKKEEEFYV